MPDKRGLRSGLSFYVLSDVTFQYSVAHPLRLTVLLQRHLVQVVAIRAAQVAGGAPWFGQDVKRKAQGIELDGLFG